MPKGPKDPKEVFPEVISDSKEVFGEDLVSIILYGSAAEGHYRPGKSDINFLIVLSDTGIDQLDRAFPKMGKWRKRKIATPLFLTEDYIQSSVDVYPIEYLNFQHHYILVYGKDLLKDLVIDPRMLRLQCEREIKGKLLLLRRTFLETEGKPQALMQVIAYSLTAFMAIFEGLLALQGHEVLLDRRERIRKVCQVFGLDQTLFETLMDVREEKVKLKGAEIRELFKGYLRQVRELARKVDAMEV